MIDEREGRPSASSMGRVFRCNGSFDLIRRLKDCGKITEIGVGALEEPEYVSFGNEVHEYMLSPSESKFAGLSSEGQWMVKRFNDLFDQAISQTGLDHGTVIRERRLWDITHQFNGKMDVAVVLADDRVGSVFDFKSGRVEVDAADRNHQLRTLAVLVAQNYKLKKVYAGVIQPRARIPLTLCEYNESDLITASSELLQLMAAIAKPNAPLNPGDWCAFCPANSWCPALGRQVLDLVVKGRPETEPTFSDISTLTNVQLSEVLNMAKRARAFLDSVEDRAKHMLRADPGAVPGWMVTPDTEIRSVEDAGKAYELLQELLEPEEFTHACKVHLTKLDEVFSERWKGKYTKAEAKSMLRALLSPAMVTSTRSGSLKRSESPHDTSAPVAIEAAPQQTVPDLRPEAGEIRLPL